MFSLVRQFSCVFALQKCTARMHLFHFGLCNLCAVLWCAHLSAVMVHAHSSHDNSHNILLFMRNYLCALHCFLFLSGTKKKSFLSWWWCCCCCYGVNTFMYENDGAWKRERKRMQIKNENEKKTELKKNRVNLQLRNLLYNYIRTHLMLID